MADPAPYQRVSEALRARIADGTWPAGHRLPPRSALGAEFGGVGENVIRRAQELLIAEGLLEGRPGAGTYVRTRPAHADLPRTAGPGRPVLALAPPGVTSWDAESTAKVPVPAPVAARLRIAPGDPCVRTEYEFLDSDRRPVMLSTSWEPMAITGRTSVVLPDGGPLAGRGVAERMALLGITVARAVERIRPVQLDRDQARQLGLPAGALATLVERTYLDEGGRPVETADLLVPATLWDITYDLADADIGASTLAGAPDRPPGSPLRLSRDTP
ncbi:GntR family transcriptional regulator [Streptomyces goshikiensis]|uniref:GntR family transcriptional regulator n=1 Tax=Streptomyces goshikiensis TaxID=1942 RepID=UPI00332EEAB0